MGKRSSETMKIAALFPGQGSQYVGMGKFLLHEFSWTKEVFEEASDAIGVNIKNLCLNSTIDELTLTSNAQPAILTVSYACFLALKRNMDFRPTIAAGHSLGEYTALLASGVISLQSAVKLVRKRGELMQNAVPVGVGKMSALLGLNDESVIEICKLASQGENSIVVPANYNAPMQIVISGHADAVERAEEIAKTNSQFKAKKIIPLKVSAPFHSPLMKNAAEIFYVSLKETPWKESLFPVVCNVDAKERKEGDWSLLLKDQMYSPLLWTQSVRTMEKRCNVFVEMEPQAVLTGLSKRIVQNEARFYNINSIQAFKEFEKFYGGTS